MRIPRKTNRSTCRLWVRLNLPDRLIRRGNVQATWAVACAHRRFLDGLSLAPMATESSAYPEPHDFEVMRPNYHEKEDGFVQATIMISPFRVQGESATKAGARRAALYEAQKTYKSYHPGYTIDNPYPERFVDGEGMEWHRVPAFQRATSGDYRFVDEQGEEDYVDIETMLLWDVRPERVLDEA